METIYDFITMGVVNKHDLEQIFLFLITKFSNYFYRVLEHLCLVIFLFISLNNQPKN